MALAYLQARPHLYSSGIVEEAITRSRSAFEQYHAMKAARDTMLGHPGLPLEQMRALRDALDHASHDPRVEGDRLIVATEAVAIADRRLAQA